MSSTRRAQPSPKTRKVSPKKTGSMAVGVASIMTKRVQSVRPDTSLEMAMELLMSRDISHLPVIEDGLLVGVLSKTDLVRERMLNGSNSTRDVGMAGFHEDEEGLRTVSDIMSTKVRQVSVESTIAEAAIAMTKFRIHGLPVVNERGGVASFVSTLDIVRWVAQSSGS